MKKLRRIKEFYENEAEEEMTRENNGGKLKNSEDCWIVKKRRGRRKKTLTNETKK
jgi:hypothetical protein